jgi:hypothetical protein
MIIITKKSSTRALTTAPGFASLLTVTSVGLALLIILVSMYENTIVAHDVQKNSLLKNDYQQREDAFLRALTNIIPNRAIMCMQDNSSNSPGAENLQWKSIINDALELSNSRQALSPDIAGTIGVDSHRSGNNTDSYLDQSTIITALSGTTSNPDAITSGTNLAATNDYPPPLNCSSTEQTADTMYPVVSFNKIYGMDAEGWVQASVEDFPFFNLINAPEMHFNYQNSSSMIAKHNWWVFEMSFASQDAALTRVVSRKKKYLISLYEIPSQLPISASSFTTFGTHSDGTEWSNVSLKGSIFAEKVKTEGSFSTDAIAARKGVEVSSNTTVNGDTTGADGTDPFESNARELAQTQGKTFPISSSSDGGRVTFIPINRGLEFYDRYTGDPDSESNSNNAISPTSWDYYSIGAKQCSMRLDVIDVESATDQTPTAIKFSYWQDDPNDGISGDLERVSIIFRKNPNPFDPTEQNWPGIFDANGDSFPFHIDKSYSGRPCLAIYAERLTAWLQNNNAGYFETNKSISVNVDYINNPTIAKPPFPTGVTDLALMLMDAKDLTIFSKGFSMVTNMRLIFTDDINITPTTLPDGVILPTGEQFYPPVSFFAPEKRFGDSGIALKIDLDGQLGSLAKGNSEPVRIADLKSSFADEIIPENIEANLKTIDHPAALPPINMMNWMVVIREIHPKYNPDQS